MYKKIFKQIIDLLLSFVFLIILSPLFLSIGFILAFANNGCPFFVQKRPGKDERIFNLIKFKTMNDKVDSKGKLLPDHLRITPIGKWVRKFSFDEIPQLINVVKGDMSLIGPRPLLVKYLPLYNDFQHRRHETKPGITGWAQINGRNTISWEDKFKFDVWYVENIRVSIDVKILIMTMLKVFKSEGVNQGVNLTMEEFKGSL